MNVSRDFERRITDFYAGDPGFKAPDRLLAQTLNTIASTPLRRAQLRAPWRYPSVSNSARLAAAAIAVFAVLLIGFALWSNRPGIGTPSTPSPSPTPTPTQPATLGPSA